MERFSYFAMDMNLRNRDLTQHNSYPIPLEDSGFLYRRYLKAAKIVRRSEEGIVVGCEEVLEGHH